jgi:protein TonB
MARIFGIVVAVLFHAALILFGGLLFWTQEPEKRYQNVELVSDIATKAEEQKDKSKDKSKDKPEPEKKNDDVQSQDEKPPDAQEIVRSIEASVMAAAPALEAASLGAIEAALGGATLGDGGDFASALTFASGGRIGGTGKAGATLEEKFEAAFSLAEIDQKPRALFQTAPSYPSELRTRKIEGVVQVLFVVDQQGKVVNARAEQSTHEAFTKPALDAVRRWKFEPGVKGGQKVQCKMRVPIRFQPS